MDLNIGIIEEYTFRVIGDFSVWFSSGSTRVKMKLTTVLLSTSNIVRKIFLGMPIVSTDNAVRDYCLSSMFYWWRKMLIRMMSVCRATLFQPRFLPSDLFISTERSHRNRIIMCGHNMSGVRIIRMYSIVNCKQVKIGYLCFRFN